MMSKFFHRWVLGLVLCAAQQIDAQSLNNPGFVGRTQSVSTGTQLSAGIYKGLQTQALWVASYEKTLRRDLLVQLRYTAGALNVAFPQHTLIGIECGISPTHFDCGWSRVGFGCGLRWTVGFWESACHFYTKFRCSDETIFARERCIGPVWYVLELRWRSAKGVCHGFFQPNGFDID